HPQCTWAGGDEFLHIVAVSGNNCLPSGHFREALSCYDYVVRMREVSPRADDLHLWNALQSCVSMCEQLDPLMSDKYYEKAAALAEKTGDIDKILPYLSLLHGRYMMHDQPEKADETAKRLFAHLKGQDRFKRGIGANNIGEDFYHHHSYP